VAHSGRSAARSPGAQNVCATRTNRSSPFSSLPLDLPPFAIIGCHEQSMLQDENAKFEPPSESDYTPNGYQAKRFVEHGQRAKRGLCVGAQEPCDAVVKVREKAGNREAEVKKNGAG